MIKRVVIIFALGMAIFSAIMWVVDVILIRKGLYLGEPNPIIGPLGLGLVLLLVILSISGLMLYVRQVTK